MAFCTGGVSGVAAEAVSVVWKPGSLGAPLTGVAARLRPLRLHQAGFLILTMTRGLYRLRRH